MARGGPTAFCRMHVSMNCVVVSISLTYVLNSVLMNFDLWSRFRFHNLAALVANSVNSWWLPVFSISLMSLSSFFL